MKWLLVLAVLSSAAFATNSASLIGTCVNQNTPARTCTITGTTTIGDSALVLLQTAPSTVTALLPTIPGSLCWPVRTWDVDGTQGAQTVYLFSWICPNLTSASTTVTVNAADSVTTVSFAAAALDLGGLGTYPQSCGAPSTWPSYGQGGSFSSGSSSTFSTNLTDTSGCLQIGFGGQQAVGPGTTCTAGPGFTVAATINATAALTCVEYNLSSAGGTNAVSLTTNTSNTFGWQAISLQNGSTQYAQLSPQPNGKFVQMGPITNQGCSVGTSGTCAFPSLITAPGGNVVMVYRAVPSGGQGSGGNSAPAVIICNSTCQSTGGASGWVNYSGTTYGTQCSGLPNGFVYSGDCANADLVWAPSGLFVYNSTIYMTVSVLNSALSACVGASIGTANSNGTNFNALVTLDPNGCWGGQLAYIPAGACATYPTGVLIAPISDAGVKWYASTDGGNTWAVLTSNNGLIFNATENSTVWTGGCNLVGVARAAAGQPERWYATSNFGTSFTNGSTNVSTTGNPANNWQLTNPVIINPNQGDGNLSLLYFDRNTAQFRVTNFLPSTLTSTGTIGNGQVIVSTPANAGSNTQGYGTATLMSGSTWMFAWYGPNGSGNGQLYTMTGTYAPSTVAPLPMPF